MNEKQLEFGDNIAGIDYSLTSPCVCIHPITPSGFSFEQCKIYYLSSVKKKIDVFYNGIIQGIEYPTYDTEIKRYLSISNFVMDKLISYRTRYVHLEGYSMGSKGKVFHIAENTAILKLGMHMSKVKYESIPPTTIKKFASGKGNASKEIMYESFVKETGMDISSKISPGSSLTNPVTDIVDAFYIAKHAHSLVLEKLNS